MPARDPLDRHRREVLRRAQALAETRREDYPTRRGFRVALNRRGNALKRAVTALVERAEREGDK